MRWAVNCTQWIPTKQEWLAALGCLQREEVERVGRFVFQRDSKLALVGRLLIRAALSLLLHLKNSDIQLTRSEKGKPLLIRNGRIDNRVGFNISHQGDYSVLATEYGTDVGVDVMQFTKPRGTTESEFFHTMRRQFTAREWEQIKHSCSSQLATFYRFWCLKESFIKAEGTGLSFGLQNLEFHTDPSHPWPPASPTDVVESTRLYVKGQLIDKWKFQEYLLNSQHCVAVATSLVSSHTAVSDECSVFTHTTVPRLLHTLAADQPETNMDELWTLFTEKSP